MHHQLSETVLAYGCDAGLPQPDSEFLSGQVAAVRERRCDDFVAASDKPGIDFEPALVVRHGCADSWSGEAEHPADVSWRNKMPRRTHHVRSKDGSRSECAFHCSVGSTFHPHRERPFGADIILRLHGAEPADDLFRLAQAARRQPLAVKAGVSNHLSLV